MKKYLLLVIFNIQFEINQAIINYIILLFIKFIFNSITIQNIQFVNN